MNFVEPSELPQHVAGVVSPFVLQGHDQSSAAKETQHLGKAEERHQKQVGRRTLQCNITQSIRLTFPLSLSVSLNVSSGLYHRQPCRPTYRVRL